MACNPLIENGKHIGFACGSFTLEQCLDCGDTVPPAEFLCDYPVGKRKTCDRKLCEKCARVVGRDMHYCDAHYKQWKDYEESGKGQAKILDAIAKNKKIQIIK